MARNPSRPTSRAFQVPRALSRDRRAWSVGAMLGAARDFVEMAKPGITVFVIFTAAMGLWLAPAVALSLPRMLAFLALTAVLVGAGNILNCWIEREVDGLMFRTRNRPLPAGRLDPTAALLIAGVAAAAALPALAMVANRLTALLGLASLAIYAAIYTPLKRVTPRAVEIGAIPGAIPPLMGWAAATGGLAAPAWSLFAIMFLWQLPHFISIALYLEQDYARGGIRVLPVAVGPRKARRVLFGYTLLLVGASVLPTVLGVTGNVYLATALLLGSGFVTLAVAGLRGVAGAAWARRTFLYSLLYLAVLFTVLVLDAR